MVYRGPGPGGYTEVKALQSGEISPLAFERVVVDVGKLP